jgi:hypothetical protein
MGVLDLARYTGLNRIKWFPFLDLLEFKKADALAVLTRDYAYKPYAYKHYESVFTRFYQGYILPRKFGIDKRKLHLSTLVITGQMTRDEALTAAAGIAYPDEKALAADKQYFIKKMQWDMDKLDRYIARPRREHDQYPSEAVLFERLLKIYRRINPRAGQV